MNWDAIGAISELVGLILVIISLGYVSIQLRQNTKTVRAATELETGRMWTDFLAKTAHSEAMADIWDKGHTNEADLTPTEKRRFIWILSEYFSVVENLHRQRDLNFLSYESWSQHEATVAGMLLNPLVDRWWNDGVTPFSPSFRAAIDRARTERGDAIWKYTPLSDL